MKDDSVVYLNKNELNELKFFNEKQSTIILVDSKPAFIVIPIARYEAMREAYEELEDIQDVSDRFNETSISLEDYEKKKA